MKEITLTKFLETHPQTEAAEVMGVNQSAVSQMLRSGRDIRLTMDGEGNVTGTYEHKPIGRSAEKAA